MYGSSVLCMTLVLLAPMRVIAATELVIDLALYGNKPGIHVVENGVTLASYPIAAPRHTPSCVRERDVFGIVTAIDRHATWRPTAKTRAAKARQGIHLKQAYGPKERGNALAGFKVEVNWINACFDQTVRIHGTYDTHLVYAGAHVSRGCFRAIPRDLHEITARAPVGTRVRVTRSFVP